MKSKNKRVITIAVPVLVLAALACTCNPPLPTAQIPTAVPQADASAVPPTSPAATAVPGTTGTVAPTATDAPDVPGPGDCTLNAKFVKDVTIPDGTELSPNAAFVKVWRMRNSGTCTWEAGTELVFSSGDQMGGPADIPVTTPVAPGGEVDISASLIAPNTPGVYQGKWQLRDHKGTFFGSAIWVKIVVPSPATNTPTPTPTPTPLPGPMCTPPSCSAGEVAICPGLCTGGCGMVCATVTPSTPDVPPPLAGVWSALGGAGGTLGDPTGNAAVDRWTADQRFQHGYMYWRNNEGSPADYIYVLYYGGGGTDKTEGTWERYQDTWVEGMDILSCSEATPPNGPRRGFGKVWCDHAGVRSGLDDATEQEQGVNAAFQDFEGGTLLWSKRLHYIYAIFDDGTWERFAETP
jgi:hypothetical protein